MFLNVDGTKMRWSQPCSMLQVLHHPKNANLIVNFVTIHTEFSAMHDLSLLSICNQTKRSLVITQIAYSMQLLQCSDNVNGM